MRTQFLSFLAIGGLTTVVQYLVLIVLTETTDLDPVLGSTTGYLLGAIINYYLNYRVTFRSSEPHLVALPRFTVVATAGMVLNALIMFVATRSLDFSYLLSQIAASGCVLCWNFVVNRVWTYQAHKSLS